MTDLHVLDPNPSGSPAVLFLHGLGSNGSAWTPQFAPLAETGYRPLAPDVPGFGQSPYDGRGWSLRRMASLLAGWLQEIGMAPVHVVGLSMGGVIAQQFALDHPQLVRKLVLASTFSVLRPENVSQWFYFIERALVVHLVGLPAQAKLVAQRVFPEPEQAQLRQLALEQIAGANPAAYRAAMRSLGLFDSRRRLGELRHPALIITGADDTTVSPARQEMLAQAIQGARQVVIPQAGHAVNIDQMQSFNQVLLEFLEDGE
jgi:3-oxoadipate enol-lactonase